MPHRALPGAAAPKLQSSLPALAIVVALAPLPGCGGTESGRAGGSYAALGAEARVSALATRPEPAPAVSAPLAAKAAAAPTQAIGPSRYDLNLHDDIGRVAPTFELEPVDGLGYPTVFVRVVLRGQLVVSPVANVQAYCVTPARCEYLPPRNGDHALKYTVSIGNDSIARLSPAKDVIAITTRVLKVDEPVVVIVTLTVDEQPLVTAQIKYLRASN